MCHLNPVFTHISFFRESPSPFPQSSSLFQHKLSQDHQASLCSYTIPIPVHATTQPFGELPIMSTQSSKAAQPATKKPRLGGSLRDFVMPGSRAPATDKTSTSAVNTPEKRTASPASEHKAKLNAALDFHKDLAAERKAQPAKSILAHKATRRGNVGLRNKGLKPNNKFGKYYECHGRLKEVKAKKKSVKEEIERLREKMETLNLVLASYNAQEAGIHSEIDKLGESSDDEGEEDGSPPA